MTRILVIEYEGRIAFLTRTEIAVNVWQTHFYTKTNFIDIFFLFYFFIIGYFMALSALNPIQK